MTKADAITMLGEQRLRDAEAAGWIKPASKAPGKNGTVIYNPAHVLRVRERILAGEYPGAPA